MRVVVPPIGAIVCFHRKISSSDAVREGHLRGKDKRLIRPLFERICLSESPLFSPPTSFPLALTFPSPSLFFPAQMRKIYHGSMGI